MWRLWIDTGGTFTDCLGLDPEGSLHRAKVLSSSGLRGAVAERIDDESLRVDWALGDDLAPPVGFFVGGRLRGLSSGQGQSHLGSAETETGTEIEASGSGGEVRAPGHGLEAGDRVEARFDEEAPVLAARLVTASSRVEDLPALELRLATTRGTNALLERRGARTVFLVTKGFADLLRIGDQRRPDLFALRIDRPEPLYEQVLEVEERLAADGTVVTPLDLDGLQTRIADLNGEGFEAAAVALLHSYVDPRHENRVVEALAEAGFEHVSASADLSPSIRILPRAQTALVDAYLSPVVGRYLARVRQALGGDGGRRLVRVMTSAGGLVGADRFRAKDSLLSGPAGGVVGAARTGRELGLQRLVAFDMGGTSTDVSRFDGDFEYRYEQRVGDAQIAAPSLAIETVAAGGGSVCGVDGLRLKVGPESAGASPGPACYGAGGPLTLTDVNLLLGRLDPQRFGIPVDTAAAEAAVDSVLASLRAGTGGQARTERDDLLRGFLEIADLRMAGAVRRISVRQGYDPRDYALVAFGGAGGQHACAVAEELGISTVVLPREAGLLSALGLGSARIERFAQRQVLQRLDEFGGLESVLSELADEALSELATEGVDESARAVRRRIAFLRFAGQDATLEVELAADAGTGELGKQMAADFLRRYGQRFGYRPDERPIEVESLRVVASTPEESRVAGSSQHSAQFESWNELPRAEPVDHRRVCFDAWRDVPVFEITGLGPGLRVDGPALIFDAHASLTLAPGWRTVRSEVGSLVARRRDSD